MAHAYGDALGPTLERLLNMAGAWSQMRVAAAHGEIPAGLDITPAIGEAVQLLDRARSSNTPVGRQQLAGVLDRYVEQAMEARPGVGLFGEPETTAADIFRAISGGNNLRVAGVAAALEDAIRPGAGELPEHVAASQAAERAAAAAATDHVGAGAEASLFGDVAEQRRPIETPSARASEAPQSSGHADIDSWKIGDPLPADVAAAEARSRELAQNPRMNCSKKQKPKAKRQKPPHPA